MKTIAAAKFKAECLAILDQVDPEGVVITKHGKPVARLMPIQEGGSGFLVGAMEGKLKIKGDLLSTGRKWNSQ